MPTEGGEWRGHIVAATHLQLVSIRTQYKMVAVTVLLRMLIKWLLLINCTSDRLKTQRRRLNVSCLVLNNISHHFIRCLSVLASACPSVCSTCVFCVSLFLCILWAKLPEINCDVI